MGFLQTAGSIPTRILKRQLLKPSNGESIVVFYNPRCTASTYPWAGYNCTQVQMCANFVYDLNGKKGPNMLGKDIGFITALYPTDPVVVAPMPIRAINTGWGSTFSQLNEVCRRVDPDSRVPNIEELKSLMYNEKLVQMEGIRHRSATRANVDSIYALNLDGPILLESVSGTSSVIKCIKR